VALCRRFQVTPAGFYAWLSRTESAHAKQDRVLVKAIVRVFARHQQRYGSPRVHRDLIAAGWHVSRRRVARLMREAGLRAKAGRGYRPKVRTLQVYARHPNRLRTMRVTGPNQVWVGDITYLKAGGAWRYLAIVMDLHTRRIFAWSLTRQRTAAITSAVLRQAARRRTSSGTVFHSDRGSEYISAAFGATVVRLGMQQSANASGPGDNAHAESFFHSLKAELTRGVVFANEHMLRRALTTYLHYYNTVRRHSGLAYLSPLAFERRVA